MCLSEASVPHAFRQVLVLTAGSFDRSLVSLAFFQIIRNTVPLFTVLIYRLWFSRTYATGTYLSLIPIVAGAGMCTAGDYHYSLLGLIVTISGVVLAAVKVCHNLAHCMISLVYFHCLLTSGFFDFSRPSPQTAS